jgi:hypothetical protein
MKVFGWERGRGRWRSSPGSQKFDRRDIGAQTYDAVLAAVSRSVRRLEDRGLVQRVSGALTHWSGLNLTEDGVRMANCLVGFNVKPTQPIEAA